MSAKSLGIFGILRLVGTKSTQPPFLWQVRGRGRVRGRGSPPRQFLTGPGMARGPVEALTPVVAEKEVSSPLNLRIRLMHDFRVQNFVLVD